MKIKLKKKKKEYAQVHRTMLFDKRLSNKAKGIGAILEYYSDEWELTLVTLIDKSKDSKKSVKSGLLELEVFEYLFRFQIHENGRMSSIWYFDSETLDYYELSNILYKYKNIYQATTIEIKLQGTQNGTPVTGYPFCGSSKRGSSKCTTYNNSFIKTTTTIQNIIKAKEAGELYQSIVHGNDFTYEYNRFKTLNEESKRTVDNWKRWCIQIKKFPLNKLIGV